MKNIFLWIKKHKFGTFFIIVFITFIIVAGVLRRVFIANQGQPLFGNRRDEIKGIEISKTNIKKLEEGLKANKEVKKVDYNLKGRTVNIIITFNDEVSRDKAKEIGGSSLNYFDDEQKRVYSIQIFLDKENHEKKDFPIIGYKHHDSSNVSWTKDR